MTYIQKNPAHGLAPMSGTGGNHVRADFHSVNIVFQCRAIYKRLFPAGVAV